ALMVRHRERVTLEGEQRIHQTLQRLGLQSALLAEDVHPRALKVVLVGLLVVRRLARPGQHTQDELRPQQFPNHRCTPRCVGGTGTGTRRKCIRARRGGQPRWQSLPENFLFLKLFLTTGSGMCNSRTLSGLTKLHKRIQHGTRIEVCPRGVWAAVRSGGLPKECDVPRRGASADYGTLAHRRGATLRITVPCNSMRSIPSLAR